MKPLSDDARTHLAMIAAQARGTANALARTKEGALPETDYTGHEVRTLIQKAHDLLGESPEAGLLPRCSYEVGRRTIPKSAVMAMAERLAAALETLLAQEPSRVEQLEQEKQALEAKVREADARAIAIVDDVLHDRCFDLLLRPGKADTAVAAACTVLEDRLRELAGLPATVDGVDLVKEALKPKEGVLVLSDVAAEQEGFHLLCRGIVGFFRNPPSHRLIEDYDVRRARQTVGFIDALLGLLRETKKRGPNGGGAA